MKIQQGTIVKVTGQPGAVEKWPRFFAGFLGKRGKVVGQAQRGKWDDAAVKMIVALEGIGHVSIDREWLTQVRA